MRILWIVSDVPNPTDVAYDEVRTAEFTPTVPQWCRACGAASAEDHLWQVTEGAFIVQCSEQVR